MIAILIVIGVTVCIIAAALGLLLVGLEWLDNRRWKNAHKWHEDREERFKDG